MSDSEENKALQTTEQSKGELAEALPAEIQNLPPEMRTMVSVMAGFFRSNSGPDAETAKIMAEAEMHEETCKLQAYTQSMQNRNQANERDHIFRMKKLAFETGQNVLVGLACVAGIGCGLYLMLVRGDKQVGTPILVASFMAMLGVKPDFNKEKE